MDPNQMRQKSKFFQVKISDCSLPEAGRTKGPTPKYQNKMYVCLLVSFVIDELVFSDFWNWASAEPSVRFPPRNPTPGESDRFD